MGYAAREFYVPFSKVDKEKRIVYGVAQAEIPDLQNDLVTFDASKEAFSKWSRNIREMHDPVAIGRAISVVSDDTKKEIIVGAKISLGAEDAWQKVLDGTYQGFSIGGYPTKAQSIMKDGKRLREITEYVLEELSLVDTPANPACLVRAITKRGKLLVATDVLGNLPLARTARDVLSPEVKTMAKRAKIAGLVEFNKGLGEKDEVLVARISDFKKNADGSYTLPPNASIAHIKKGDLDADGYDNPSDGNDDEQGSPADVDFEGMAKSAAGIHKGLCKSAGIEDHIGHYADSVGEDGDDTPGAEDETTEKSGVNRNRKGSFSKSAMKQFGDILATSMAALEKKFNEKIDALAPAAPRKGEDGAIVKRSDGAIGTDASASTEVQPGSVEALKKNLDELHKRRDDLLKSGAVPKTPAERQMRDQLARDVSNAEVAYAQAMGHIAR